LIRYIIKRILLLIPILIAVSFIVYALLDLTPGTIVDAMISESMTAEDIKALRSEYDLDKPMVYRYGKYMINLVQGDLGVSYITKTSVWDTYVSRLPPTLLLAFSGLIIGASVGIPLGIRSARNAGSISDNATTVFVLLGVSMPAFWLALLLLQLFSLQLGWLPAGGMKHGIRSLILPAVCSGLMLMATSTRQTRSGMLEVLKADYLRTARAKGVPEESVIRRHALGNAWIPILTAMGASLANLLAGSVVIEQVFSWPGVGRLTIEAVQQRDVPTVLGCVIMTTGLYVLVYVIVDILYAFVDPRIKSQYTGKSGKKKRTTVASTAPVVGRPPDVPHKAVTMAAVVNNNDIRQDNSVNEPVVIQATEILSEPGFEDDRPVKMQSINEKDEPSIKTKKTSVTRTTFEIKESVTAKQKKRGQFVEIFYRIRKNKGAMAGLVIITSLLVIFIISLFISYDAVTEGVIKDRLSKPTWQYPFGTDMMGRNSFLRVLYGTRYSLAIGFGGSAIAAIIGISLGAAAGYYGGLAEEIIMRINDVLASIPTMLFGIVLMTVLGNNLRNLIIAVGVSSIPIYTRITRASILTVKGNEFVEAAKAIGFSNFRIILKQVLPNGLSPLIVTYSLNLGLVIVTAASLSYLGFGVPIPHPEWGAMIAVSRDHARSAPHLLAFPGLFIMITVLAFNLLGDGLRDALDPKLKR